ncbi:hypothetical protein [Stackebrandtia nassauensis]|uniref:hypothetical protein n=1 Tax=Stackebrandtia nassauensis TaxID=283811 RepID=UPI001186C33B|nr:hypothetical protein [Stackebrandtia nassauensis]
MTLTSRIGDSGPLIRSGITESVSPRITVSEPLSSMNLSALGPGSWAPGNATVSIELRSRASVKPKPCWAISREVDMTMSPSHEVARPTVSVCSNGSAEIPKTSTP